MKAEVALDDQPLAIIQLSLQWPTENRMKPCVRSTAQRRSPYRWVLSGMNSLW